MSKTRVASIKSKGRQLKKEGFEQLTECFGGLGCIFGREDKELDRFTLINTENDSSITMTINEFESFCKKISNRKKKK